MIRTLPFALIFFSFIACTPAELSREKLFEFVSDESNGLSKTCQANDYVITCQYQPVDLVFSAELAREPKASFVSKRDSLRSAYSRFLYFRFKISRKDKSIEQFFAGDPERYKTLGTYLSSLIGKDMMMESNSVSSEVFDFVYTPFYGTSNATQVLVAFEIKGRIEDDVNVIFQDSFLGCGRTEFLFGADDILKAPLLKSE